MISHVKRYAVLFLVMACCFVRLYAYAEGNLTDGFTVKEPMCIEEKGSEEYFKTAAPVDHLYAFKFLKPKKDVQWLQTPMQNKGKTPSENWAKVNGKYCYVELPSSLFLYEPVDSVDAAKEWVTFMHRYEFLIESKKSYQAIINRVSKKFKNSIQRKDFPPAYGMQAKKTVDGSFCVTIFTLSHNKTAYVEYTFTKDTFTDKSALFIDGPYMTMNMMSLPPNFVMPPEEAKIEADQFEFGKLIKDVPLKEIKYTW